MGVGWMPGVWVGGIDTVSNRGNLFWWGIDISLILGSIARSDSASDH